MGIREEGREGGTGAVEGRARGELRVRTVAEGPDGFLYVGTDQGLLFRIRPG